MNHIGYLETSVTPINYRNYYNVSNNDWDDFKEALRLIEKYASTAADALDIVANNDTEMAAKALLHGINDMSSYWTERFKEC